MVEDPIDALLQKLNSLREGEQAIKDLVAFGGEAIEPLRRFLFEGRPGVTFQPRQWAVQALAALEAKGILIDYLRWEKDISDPPTRLAEEAVEITAARALKAWLTSDVYDVLFQISKSRLQPGLVETLGEFKRVGAIPYFLNALEDDVCRASAEKALSKLGDRARPALLDTILTPTPSAEEESPSSLLRRRSALKLLSEMEIPPDLWRSLRSRWSESDPGLVVTLAQISARVGTREDRREAAKRLLQLLPQSDSILQEEILITFRRVKPRGGHHEQHI